MFLKLLLLFFSLAIVILVFDVIIPKIKLKYRLFKELRIKRKREKAFAKRMKELEIK